MSPTEEGHARAGDGPDSLAALLADAHRVRAALADAPSAGGEQESVTATISRLDASVIRPLGKAVSAQSAPETASGGGDGDLEALAIRATELCASAAGPAELLEATAALQDLTSRARASLLTPPVAESRRCASCNATCRRRSGCRPMGRCW